MVLVLKILGERSAAKICHPLSFLSVFSKVFERLVNNRLDDHLSRNVSFDFHYGFRSSRSTADLLTVDKFLLIIELLGALIGLGLLEL